MALEMSGEETIAASRETVWAALNNPEILKASIPGCESLEMTDDTHMNAVVALKIGPVKARFKGAVELQNINAPSSYTIAGEGQGGIAGFAKGGADVELTELGPQETLLRYTAKADVGGKMAQLGSRLIDSTAKKLSAQFFAKFNETVSNGETTVA